MLLALGSNYTAIHTCPAPYLLKLELFEKFHLLSKFPIRFNVTQQKCLHQSLFLDNSHGNGFLYNCGLCYMYRVVSSDDNN